MSEDKQPGAAPTGRLTQALERLRQRPGFRTAAVAFFLTVVLGIGSSAAYAYWSQSVNANITVTTVSDLPANTTLVGAQPVLAARPGTPTGYVCAGEKTHGAMYSDNYADTRFSWQAGSLATQYVVTVKSLDPKKYQYSQTQTVSANQAVFQFSRLVSDEYGKPVGTQSPFYTKYVVRVMPMNGSVAGDPLYFTYEYEHYKSDNCYYGDPSDPAGASPVGPAAPFTGNPQPLVNGEKGYADLVLSWRASSGATSYNVSMLAESGTYGGETTVSGTSTTFRIMRPAGSTAHENKYRVRVQPLNGTVAGDPVYLTYQLGSNYHNWW